MTKTNKAISASAQSSCSLSCACERAPVPPASCPVASWSRNTINWNDSALGLCEVTAIA